MLPRARLHGLQPHPSNNIPFNLKPDTRAGADCLFKAADAGGTLGMPLQDMFGGAGLSWSILSFLLFNY